MWFMHIKRGRDAHFSCTSASFRARSVSTSPFSSLLAWSMASRAVVKSPLVSSLMTSSRSMLYSEKTFRHKDSTCLQDNNGRKHGCCGSSCRLCLLLRCLSASGQTFLEDALEFQNLLVCSRCENFHQDIFICAQTLREKKQTNNHRFIYLI